MSRIFSAIFLALTLALASCPQLILASNAVGTGDDATLQTASHGHAAELPEPHDQPAPQKLLWGLILSCVSVVVFGLGNDGYALLKSYFNGARHLHGWAGQWIARPAWASLLVPTRFRERMYLTVSEQGYTLLSKGHDEEGGGWGQLLCTSGKHPVGTWELRANRQTLNLPELTLKFANGSVQAIVFKRAT